MSGKGKKTMTISRFFTPVKSDLNNDTGLIKLIAILTMFADHAGKMLFPQYRIMRLIGRIAFPIYAYCIAAGCIYTHDILKYLKRIVILALVSQPIYAMALAHTTPTMFTISFAEQPVRAAINFYVQSWTGHPNILLSLAVGVIVIWTIKEKHFSLTVAMAILVWLMQKQLDYSYKGVLLMVLFYLFASKWWVSLPIITAYLIWWAYGSSGYTFLGFRFSSQIFALGALPFIYIHTGTKIKLPKWFFYGFYPVHMILIYYLDHFVY